MDNKPEKTKDIEEEAMKAIRRRHQNLDSEFEEWRTHGIELRDYMLPRHARSLDANTSDAQNDGKKKHQKVIDSTAEDSVDILAAGMKSGVSSPSYPWFRLVIQNKKAMKSKPVKEWLFYIEDLFRTIFIQSNIYSMLHHSYMELPVFGTACALLKKDAEKVIVARQMTFGEYRLALNSKYEVDALYRDFWMTAVQLVEEFGIENVTDPVKRAFEDGNTETLFRVIHLIEPNDERIKIVNSKKRKFRSVYFEYASDENPGKNLSASGFLNFPVMAARWRVVGSDVYGSSPGMKLLGDTKMLQKMNAKYLEAVDKVLKPPMRAPGELKGTAVNQNPGEITFLNNKLQGQDPGLAPLYEVRPDLGAAAMEMEKVRMRIKNGFFNNLFLMLLEQTGRMTATEVAERHQEKLTLLGPVLENIHTMLNQLISTTYDYCMEDGLIPQPPEEIQGQPIKIEYISIIAQAQKLVGLQGIERIAGFIGNLAAANPEALDKLNTDEAIDAYADALAVPPSIIRDNKEAGARREGRAQQMRNAQMLEQAGQMAGAAKVMSETDTTRPNALTAIMGGPR
ncbi:MAG: portal protein [Victivallales bacterium]|jgi:hypothetical protein